jgi:DNA topoisomerase VI subunit B
MAGAGIRKKQKTKRADVYKKILKNYDEWHSLMVLLEAEEKELHREFLRIIDKEKLEKVMRRIGDQKV